jgi:hypothetical protein
MAHLSWLRALRDGERAPRVVLAAVFGVLMAAPEVSAQHPQSDSTRRWFTSASIGLIGVEGYTTPELMTIGMQWTGAVQGRIVPDVAVGTLPRGFAEGYLLLAGRAGAAFPLALGSGTTLLPGVGLSAIGAAGTGGGGGTWGYYGGASIVMLGERGVGLRMGITWHRFQWDASAWLLEFGIARGPRPASE